MLKRYVGMVDNLQRGVISCLVKKILGFFRYGCIDLSHNNPKGTNVGLRFGDLLYRMNSVDEFAILVDELTSKKFVQSQMELSGNFLDSSMRNLIGKAD